MPAPQDLDIGSELHALPALAELAAETLSELIPLVAQRRVLAGVNLVEQGAPSMTWQALVRGAAKVVRVTPTAAGESMTVLDVMRAPCIVTDPSIYDGVASPASVVTLRVSHVFSVERRAFLRALAMQPILSRVLMTGLAQDIRAHVRRIDEVVSGSVDERVKHLLESLAQQHGTPLGQGRFIAIPLRRKDIACMDNATTETVSRLLAKFEREGLARSTRDGIWWRSGPRPVPMPVRPSESEHPPATPRALTSSALPKGGAGRG